MAPKSTILPSLTSNLSNVARSYYCFCLEQALTNIQQARALVSHDIEDPDLPKVEKLVQELLEIV